MIVETVRAISSREGRRLQKTIRQHEAIIRAQPRSALGCLALCTPICLLVYLVKPSDPVNQWGMFILFGVFAILIAVVGTIVFFEERRKISRLKAVIECGSVVEWAVKSDRCLVVVDDDHEENYYFFDVGEETLVVCDLDIHKSNFPSSEFIISRVLGPDSDPVDEWIRCRGERLKPAKTLSIHDLPDSFEYEHLTRFPGGLDGQISPIGQLSP